MNAPQHSPIWLSRLALLGVILGFCVILLGAYTRLTDAGLGCPDWPGCYGKIIAPSTVEEITQANQRFPTSTVEVAKARTEMHHRYLAGSLGALILVLWGFACYYRRKLSTPFWLPTLLVGLVIAQGLFGMWTVTLRLLPAVVLGHLLGGLTTLSLLWLIWLTVTSRAATARFSPSLRVLCGVMLCAVSGQILLGGWTSANYAALICPDFPNCHAGLSYPFDWRALHLLGGMHLEEPLNYMDALAKISIHMMHRFGAMFTAIVGLGLSVTLWRAKLKIWSTVMIGLLVVQLGLGIANVLLSLPLAIALAHHATAVILLLFILKLNYIAWRQGV